MVTEVAMGVQVSGQSRSQSAQTGIAGCSTGIEPALLSQPAQRARLVGVLPCRLRTGLDLSVIPAEKGVMHDGVGKTQSSSQGPGLGSDNALSSEECHLCIVSDSANALLS